MKRWIVSACAAAAMAVVPASTLTGDQSPATSTQPTIAADARDWIQLFNGRDLADWTIKFAKHDLGENFHNTFRVEDGLLKVRYDQWPSFNGEFGHIFYKDPFSYYLLAAEYRFVGEQVAGAPAWANPQQRPDAAQPAPADDAEGSGLPDLARDAAARRTRARAPRTTANLCTPGTHVVYNGKLHTAHCTNSTSQTYDGDQWVRVEVLVHGDELVRHMINGQTVLEYSKPQIGGGAASAGRSGHQGRRHAADQRLYLHAGGDGADRFPQGGAAQSRRLHGPARVELPALHRQVEPGDVPLASRPAR